MEKQNVGIFGKTFLLTFAVFLIVLIISGIFFFDEYVDIYKDSAKNNVMTSAQLLSTMFENVESLNNEEEFLKEYWEEFHKQNNSIYFLIKNANEENILIFPSAEKYNKYLENHPDKIITANFKFASGYKYEIKFFIKSSSAILESLKNLPMFWASILIIGFVFAYFSAHVTSKPIEELAIETERLKNINESPKMITRNDEIGVLQESIYDLHLTLRNSILEVENEIKHISKLESSQRYFFAAASQEFKLPIASIVTILENIKQKIGNDKAINDELDDCVTRIMTLDKLIAEIVEIVQYNDSDKKVPTSIINISKVIDASLDECKPLIEKKNINVQKDIDNNINIRANFNMFYRVIMNVVSNAVQHVTDEKKVNIWVETDDKFATLYVYNDCNSIPDEVIKKLFEPFYRRGEVSINNTKNTGLGLYVVQELLNRMHISFDMKNRDQGICFSIKFKVEKSYNV